MLTYEKICFPDSHGDPEEEEMLPGFSWWPYEDHVSPHSGVQSLSLSLSTRTPPFGSKMGTKGL